MLCYNQKLGLLGGRYDLEPCNAFPSTGIPVGMRIKAIQESTRLGFLYKLSRKPARNPRLSALGQGDTPVLVLVGKTTPTAASWGLLVVT